MTITALTAQQKDHDRVNVFVDGKYRFSLDIFQVSELGIKTGKEYSEEELVALETESQFGKLYMRALEYTMMRPHSAKEVRDYLYRKTRDSRTKTGQVKKGVSPEVTSHVYDRLQQKGYIDDESFTRYWVENRHVKKGISQRKLTAELRSKGVDPAIISSVMLPSQRSDADEIQKIIAKKKSRYPDESKLVQYLMRQGFRYDDIKEALSQESDEEG
jgi:regulatory protein